MPFFLQNCKEKTELNTNLKPTYSEFKNAWESNNLYGKIKELKQLKANSQGENKFEKPILNFTQKFTDFGEIKEIESYDNFGELIQKDVYEFDSNNFLIKTISINKPAELNYIMTVKNDTVNKNNVRTLIINDSLKQQITVFYDEKDFVTKQVAIEKGDTTTINHKYHFENDNLISEIQFERDEKKPNQEFNYKYDNNRNLVESSTRTEWNEYLTKTEWKDNRILKQTEYTVSADLNKHLDRITEYDKLFNPINVKIYENSELNRELEYDYEFDKFGNWIKRTVSMKEHFANSDKFIPIYIESREIKYWN